MHPARHIERACRKPMIDGHVGALEGSAASNDPRRREIEMKELLMMWLGGFLGKVNDEKGQGLVEYALIIVLVSIACVGLLTALGLDIGTVFSNISGTLTGS